jgi:hypothetical protein
VRRTSQQAGLGFQRFYEFMASDEPRPALCAAPNSRRPRSSSAATRRGRCLILPARGRRPQPKREVAPSLKGWTRRRRLPPMRTRKAQ